MCSLSLVVSSATPVRPAIHRESQMPLGKEKTAGLCLTEGEVPVEGLGIGGVNLNDMPCLKEDFHACPYAFRAVRIVVK